MKNFEIDYKFVEYIDRGRYGEIYKINPLEACKFLFINKSNFSLLQKECEIAQIAYSEKISVPKPNGVYYIEHPNTNEILPAFIMQYIKGKTLGKILEEEGKIEIILGNTPIS